MADACAPRPGLTPAQKLHVTADGEVWLHHEGEWYWLRMYYYGAGPTFESGYAAPLAPVHPLAEPT